MRWPWSKKRREEPSVAQELGRLRLSREKLKIGVVERLAESDVRTAALILWGGSRGALQTQPESELDKLAKYKAILGSNDDGLDKMLRIRQVLREEREEMDREYGPPDEAGSSFERAFERYAPLALAGLAAVLNPTGYQQALAAEQQAQQQQVQVTEVSQQVPPSPPQPHYYQAIPERAPEEDPPNVYVMPVKPAVVLANLEIMAPAVFAQWALNQPAVAEKVEQLAKTPNEGLGAVLGAAEFLYPEWKEVFAWLRANPERTSAIIQALRVMLSDQSDGEDAVGL